MVNDGLFVITYSKNSSLESSGLKSDFPGKSAGQTGNPEIMFLVIFSGIYT